MEKIGEVLHLEFMSSIFHRQHITQNWTKTNEHTHTQSERSKTFRYET